MEKQKLPLSGLLVFEKTTLEVSASSHSFLQELDRCSDFSYRYFRVVAVLQFWVVWDGGYRYWRPRPLLSYALWRMWRRVTAFRQQTFAKNFKVQIKVVRTRWDRIRWQRNETLKTSGGKPPVTLNMIPAPVVVILKVDCFFYHDECYMNLPIYYTSAKTGS